MSNIGTRLTLIFAAVGMLSVGLVTLALHGFSLENERAERVYREVTLPAQYFSEAYRSMLIVALQVYEADRMTDPSSRQSQFAVVDSLLPVLEKDLELFKNSTKPTRTEAVARDLIRDMEGALPGLIESVQLAKSGDVAASMNAMTGKSRSYGIAAGADMTKLNALFNAEAEAAHLEAASSYRKMRALLSGALLAAGASLTFVVWRQMRSLGKSLTGIQGTLLDASHSLDLSKRAESSRDDEIGRTAHAYNELMKCVGDALRDVRLAAMAVKNAALELASGNEDLSTRTEEQATSLEEAASTMSKLTEKVKQNAENALNADVLTDRAVELADASHVSMREMVTTIKKISSGSQKITEITGMIEEIAFQTNILALNAAVESARAGEHGRGFAVVASEVRSLAQRSAAAAKEVKQLITTSLLVIQDGETQAGEVGAAMDNLKQAIRQVSAIVREITTASQDQSHGIEQVNQTIVWMDEVTQRNAALVEEASAAAHLLEEQSLRLTDAVSVFKIDDWQAMRQPV